MSDRLRIPLDVERAVLAWRGELRGLNSRAETWNAQHAEHQPNEPHVEVRFVTKPNSLMPELQFWRIADDQALEDFLFDDLLSGVYGNESIDWEHLPAGYLPLLRVLEFERHCQFEGWTAVSNEGADEMALIVEAYRFVGLESEANALTAVNKAYVDLAEDGSEQFHEIIGAAYRSVPNVTPEIEDRMPVILAFVRSHPELFGVLE